MSSAIPVSGPPGFRYYPDFLSHAEECRLIEEIERLPLSEVNMHGRVSKRRTAHFGWIYGYESWRLTPGPAMPDFLIALRTRIATLDNLVPDEFTEALITHYPPGAGIGWHRDAPMFGPVVVGISLVNRCRFWFQRRDKIRQTMMVILEPRSAYVLSGAARFQWQHRMTPVQAVRYSLTFRTVRPAASPD
jgi:alkylated DNA repair dioxygenase AlkB